MIEPREWFFVKYLTLEYRTGRVKEKYWEEPFRQQWGAGRIVKGWEPGLEGMRVGGLRELIVPSSWAYGDEALVYLIELLDLEER